MKRAKIIAEICTPSSHLHDTYIPLSSVMPFYVRNRTWHWRYVSFTYYFPRYRTLVLDGSNGSDEEKRKMSNQTTDQILFLITNHRATLLKNISAQIASLDPEHPNYKLRLLHLKNIESDLLRGAVSNPALSHRKSQDHAASKN